MQYIFLSILGFPFLFINYKIILSDIKHKKIPNQLLVYLLYLFPLYFLYSAFYFPSIDYLLAFIQFILTFLVSFILYYFGIWSAGDAKYLLVLGIFVSHIGIVPFLGNIALLTLLYLAIYFFYFYFGMCLFNFGLAKSVYQNIYTDLRDGFLTFLKNTEGKISIIQSLRIVFSWILLFLFFFVGFRLLRLTLMAHFISNNTQTPFLGDFFQEYHLYILILIFLGFWIIRYLGSQSFIHLKNKLAEKFGFHHDKTKITLPLVLCLILIGVIAWEYNHSPYEISEYLHKIFSLYIFLYLASRFAFYIYKTTFQIGETYFLDIEKLQEGEIVDKTYLINMFGSQSSLGFQNQDGLLSPNPKDYFLNISNPIDSETAEKLKKIFQIVNQRHLEEKSKNFSKIEKIKVLKTFAFGIYIFLGFIISFIFGDMFIAFLTQTVVDFILSFPS